MNMAAEVQAKPAPPSSFTPVRTNLLQRKCACGGTPGLDGECAECREKRLQRRSTSQAQPAMAPPIVHEVLRSPGQPIDPEIRTFFESRISSNPGQGFAGTASARGIQVSEENDPAERDADEAAERVFNEVRRGHGAVGTDFGRVRVHRDTLAAESAR